MLTHAQQQGVAAIHAMVTERYPGLEHEGFALAMQITISMGGDGEFAAMRLVALLVHRSDRKLRVSWRWEDGRVPLDCVVQGEKTWAAVPCSGHWTDDITSTISSCVANLNNSVNPENRVPITIGLDQTPVKFTLGQGSGYRTLGDTGVFVSRNMPTAHQEQVA